MAVLNGQFQVRGVKNLRVVDASVFPDIPGMFITTPIYTISEKAADSILSTAQVNGWNTQSQSSANAKTNLGTSTRGSLSKAIASWLGLFYLVLCMY